VPGLNIVALILFIVAAVLFIFGRGYRGAPGWYSHVDLGLFFLTVAFIVQFAAKSHTVRF
jgi:hypothetical protein